MPRPPKRDEEKRTHRLTVYLTEEEREMLGLLAERENRPMTQVLVLAMKEYLSNRLNPPEPLKKAMWERIMREERVWLKGFVCRNGHPFWIEAAEPMQPDICPVCRSERQLARTWEGIIQRGHEIYR